MGESKIVKEDDIDLIELVKVLWFRKWFIAKVTVVFTVLGLVIAFTSPEEYTTSSILIPETVGAEGGISGSLGGLASLAGVDLGGLTGGAGQSINPALYQSVSRSTPFLLELMDQEYFFEELGEEVSIYNYYIYHFKTSLFGKLFALPGIIIYWIKGAPEDTATDDLTDSGSLALTEYQQRIIEDLQTRIMVEMDWELNVLNVQVEMQDAKVAAQMAQFTQDYITDYVTNYSISKSTRQLESLEQQFHDRKKEFENAQYRLALFRDRNQNVNTARAQSEQERLQSEYNLAFNIYNQLAQQREAIKLQIQEDTPVFTVLEPVKVPVEKSEPIRLTIIISFTVIGLALGIFYSGLQSIVRRE